MTTTSPDVLQMQLNDAHELLENQYRQVQTVTDDLHALQDAMRLKDMEIERLQRDANDLAALQAARPSSVSLSSPHDARANLEIMNFEGATSMSLNVELQAKMIEELLVKNAQLADENTAAQQMRGPFGGGNDSMNEGHPNSYGMPSLPRESTMMSAGSYRDNLKIAADETFTKFANLKSIEYIH